MFDILRMCLNKNKKHKNKKQIGKVIWRSNSLFLAINYNSRSKLSSAKADREIRSVERAKPKVSLAP